MFIYCGRWFFKGDIWEDRGFWMIMVIVLFLISLLFEMCGNV